MIAYIRIAQKYDVYIVNYCNINRVGTYFTREIEMFTY